MTNRPTKQTTVPDAAEVDAVLAALPDDVRAALERLRAIIAAAAPDAVETIAYGVPAFKYRGRPFVSYGAGRTPKGKCAFYVQSPPLMQSLGDALAGYDISKGTIRFRADEPLPEELITRIVRARVVEVDALVKR